MRRLIKQPFCANCETVVLEIKGKAICRKDNCKELWVLYNDNSNAMFFVCENCSEKMTLEMAHNIQLDQRYTWGREIIDTPLSLSNLTKQLEWFINKGALLEVIKFGNTENAI